MSPGNGERWVELGRRMVYDSDWIRLYLVDLEMPDGTVLREIHKVDYIREAAGVVPVRDDGQVLLIDHYRFQTETRGWEIPAGVIDVSEKPVEAAARELREETGHRARELVELGRYHPANGSSSQAFNMFYARGVERAGEIEDTNEVLGLRWFGPAEVQRLILDNRILDGLSLTGLLWYFLRTGTV